MSERSHSELLETITGRRARVGIFGMGYVGLPLAREFVESGFRVLGFDTDPRKIERLNAGESYIQAVPTADLKRYVAEGRLAASGDLDDPVNGLRSCDAALICVPTPLNHHREPDMSYIEATGRSIGPRLRPGQLIVLESTTWPGTTDEFLRPILEEASGLKAGEDFFLAFSPERENPGDAKWRTRDIPKVVGADDAKSRALAEALYGAVVCQVVPVSSTRAAESSKLLENIYRCVNIALVNELKVTFETMGIDVFEVIEASKTKPFGFKAFYPGPGLGGHCIPIDPFYLTWKAREFGKPTRFIELAGEVNTGMPTYVIQRCQLALNDQAKALRGSKILVLGVSYKENVDDIRESPSLEIMPELMALGAELSYHDPYVPEIRTKKVPPSHPLNGMKSSELSAEKIQDSDLLLILAAHAAVDYPLIAREAKLVVDTRNALGALRQNARARIVRA